MTGLARTWDDVAAFRLRRQRLAEPAPADALAAVAADLVGVHAQIASSAELALGARVQGIGAEDIRSAVRDDRTLVKCWGMRKTLHLFPPALLATVLAAVRTSPLYTTAHLKPAWLRYHGVTEEQMRAIDAAIPEAVSGEPLTRDELADELARITGHADIGAAVRSGWGAVLKPASFRGELCFGPDRGRNVTFVAPSEYLPDWSDPDPAASAEALVRAALRSHGPFALDDLRRWWGVRPPEARRVLERLGDEVVEIDVAGWEAFVLADDVDDLSGSPEGVHLLPGFDAYTIAATRHVEYLLARGGKREAIYRPQGWVSAVLLVDGRFAGVWKLERRGSRVEVALEPFGRLSARTKAAVADEVERIGRFLGCEATLV